MCYIENEEGEEVPLSVAEYISYSLQDDDIHLQSPICQKLLEEAVGKAHEPNFRAERYFISHFDGEIRELALKLGPDIVALSKMYDTPSNQEVNSETSSDERLDEIIPSLIASYKLNIAKQSIQDIIEQMKDPAIKADEEKVQKLKEEFRQKTLLVKELAKECGDRVVLK